MAARAPPTWRMLTAPVSLDLEEIRAAQAKLGRLTERELRTLVWVVIAIALWLTNGFTGLDIGWITLLIAMLMSMPVVGGVLEPKDWATVPTSSSWQGWRSERTAALAAHTG